MIDFNELNIENVLTIKEKQDNFNTKFLVRLMIFVTFYRFFSMYIDTDEKIIRWVDNTFCLSDNLD